MSVDTLTKCGACLGPFSLCRSIFSVGSDGGARRAARQPCPAPKKSPGVVFQGAVWCGSVATLVADPPFTRPALKKCFSSWSLHPPHPGARQPALRPPTPYHQTRDFSGQWSWRQVPPWVWQRRLPLVWVPGLHGPCRAWCGVGSPEKGGSGAFLKSSCRSKSAGSVHVAKGSNWPLPTTPRIGTLAGAHRTSVVSVGHGYPPSVRAIRPGCRVGRQKLNTDRAPPDLF